MTQFSGRTAVALPMLMLITGCGGEPAPTSPAPSAPAAVAQCAACHTFEKDGPRRTGPNIHGIIGQVAGTRPGFTYSAALKNSGITWTPETLDAYITAPSKSVPGTRMGFTGEPDATKRKAIIAYIQSGAK